MYTLASDIQNLPIVSLQSGEPVGWTQKPVIGLENLEIVAFYCQVMHQRTPLLLLASDIRQMASDCVIVDNEDDLTNPADIVRLETMLHRSFHPLGKPVISDIGRKLGSVENYSINIETSRIQKLYIKQPFLRSLLRPDLIIDRTQIIDITPKQITVRDSTLKARLLPTEKIAGTQA